MFIFFSTYLPGSRENIRFSLVFCTVALLTTFMRVLFTPIFSNIFAFCQKKRFLPHLPKSGLRKLWLDGIKFSTHNTFFINRHFTLRKVKSPKKLSQLPQNGQNQSLSSTQWTKCIGLFLSKRVGAYFKKKPFYFWGAKFIWLFIIYMGTFIDAVWNVSDFASALEHFRHWFIYYDT